MYRAWRQPTRTTPPTLAVRPKRQITMMNFGKSPVVGRTASKLARAVVGNSASTRNVSAISGLKASQVATRLGASQMTTRLPAVSVPLRQLSAGKVRQDDRYRRVWRVCVCVFLLDFVVIAPKRRDFFTAVPMPVSLFR